MAWFTRFDRFGDMHFVYGQERENTCGPSSVMMCVMKINKLAPGRAALYLEDTHPRRLRRLAGPALQRPRLRHLSRGAGLDPQQPQLRPLDPFHGQRAGQLAAAAAIWSGRPAPSRAPSVACNPIILGVNWDGSTASHWICVDGVRSVGDNYWATVCDPADADLHVQSFSPGTPFVYHASPQISFDLWGQRNANAYAGGATGRVRDWPFIYRTSS